jgi:CO/xanthine dehydrogenase FAD-binding subunit
MPKTLQEALEFRKNPALIPYAGGTDLMVQSKEDACYLFLNSVPELKQISRDSEYIRFGAACTFTEVIENPLSPGILKEACLNIAAPAIRNAGTVGGNIGNGSPKADSALIFLVTDSLLVLQNTESKRIIPLKDFYMGRKKLNLKPDELIVEILMPGQNYENYYYKKVAARNALAISRLSFAGIIDIQDGAVKNFATAFGALSDVIIRPDDIDKMLIGKTVSQAKGFLEQYKKAMSDVIMPIKGRVSAEYRKTVALNLLSDFLDMHIK